MCTSPSARAKRAACQRVRRAAARRSGRCPGPRSAGRRSGARSGARRWRRGSRRASARRRRVVLVEAADVQQAATSSCASASSGSRSGKTSCAHAGVGQGAIVQFVVRSLTTWPASLSAGKRSRPTRAGSRSSSRPGATGPERPTRAAPTLAEGEQALAVPVGDEVEVLLARVLDARALDPGVEPLDVDELGAVPVGAGRDRADHELLARLAADGRRSGRAARWRRSRRSRRRSVEGGVVHAPRLYEAVARCAVSLNDRSSQRPRRARSRAASASRCRRARTRTAGSRWPAGRPRRSRRRARTAATVTSGPGRGHHGLDPGAHARREATPSSRRRGSRPSAPRRPPASRSGRRSAIRTRNSPPSQSPRKTSRSSGTTTGSSPRSVASGSAVCAVRRSGVTNRPASGSPASRSATWIAWTSPSGASAGSPWPSSSGNGSPGTAGCDAPWRTSTTSVAPGGSANPAGDRHVRRSAQSRSGRSVRGEGRRPRRTPDRARRAADDPLGTPVRRRPRSDSRAGSTGLGDGRGTCSVSASRARCMRQRDEVAIERLADELGEAGRERGARHPRPRRPATRASRPAPGHGGRA